MKRLLPLILLFLMSALTPFAVDQNDFDRVVDFATSIKDLNNISNPQGLSDRLLLLNGTIANIAFVSDKKDDFRIAVDLVSGEWIGLDDVKIYHCTIIFEGPEFYPIFPKRKPKKPRPGIIMVNDPILVVSRALNPKETIDGDTRWELEGISVRLIK